MNAHDVLLAAAARVERGWCQGVMALDADGDIAHCADSNAAAWCAIGGVKAEMATYADDDVDDATEEAIEAAALDAIRQEAGTSSVGAWNDLPEQTQANVARTMRAAAYAILVGEVRM